MVQSKSSFDKSSKLLYQLVKSDDTNTVSLVWTEQNAKRNERLLMLTRSQLNWAMQHDWASFIDDRVKTIVVVQWVKVESGGYHPQYASWIGSFSELKAWAGY